MAYTGDPSRPLTPSMPDWPEIIDLASKSTKDAHAAYLAASDAFDDAAAALTVPPLSGWHVRREGERRAAYAAGRLLASVASGDITANDDLDLAEERRRVALRAANAAAKAYDAAARADDRLVSKLDTTRRESADKAARLRAVADAETLHSTQLAEALIRLRHKRDDLYPLLVDDILVVNEVVLSQEFRMSNASTVDAELSRRRAEVTG